MHHWHRDDYTISTDPGRLQIPVVHGYLSTSYWSAGIPREVVERSIRHSLCYGIYHGESQVGFARVITDYATYGYLADVFVLEAHRGRGLARWLLECIMETPEVQGLRRWMLVTRDAHRLYQSAGFHRAAQPERVMEKVDRDVYQRP